MPVQLRRLVPELAVLSVIDQRPRHSYAIVQALGALHPDLAFKEGTVYPLLARLEGEGVVVSSRRPAERGPPRRVYELTAAGAARLLVLQEQWGEIDVALRSLRSTRRDVG